MVPFFLALPKRKKVYKNEPIRFATFLSSRPQAVIKKGRTISQAPSTEHVGFVVNTVTFVGFFSEYFNLHLINLIPIALHVHSCINHGQWTR